MTEPHPSPTPDAAPTPDTQTALVPMRPLGALPASLAAALALRSQLRQAATALANESWGKALTPSLRSAVTEFCHRHELDPATEIHILGGNIYVNAAFYQRKLGEMIAAKQIVYAYADFIHKDARLETLEQGAGPQADWAKQESARRMQARIMNDVDENALTACIFHIMPVGIDREVTGVKAIYTDKKPGKNGGDVFVDPVGNASPMETAETRACRRAMRKLATHVKAFGAQVETIEAEAEKLSGRIEIYRQESVALPPPPAAPVHQIGGGSTISAGGPPVAALAGDEEQALAVPGQTVTTGEDGVETVTVDTTPRRVGVDATGNLFDEEE